MTICKKKSQEILTEPVKNVFLQYERNKMAGVFNPDVSPFFGLLFLSNCEIFVLVF